MNTQNKINLGPLWIFLGYFFSSASGFIAALAPESASPLSIGGVRILTGGIFFLLMGILTKKLPNFSVMPKKPVILGAFGLMLFQPCFFIACEMVGVAIASVVAIGIVPIFSGVFAWILYREKPSKIWYFSTFFMLIGLITLGFAGGVNSEFNASGIFLAMLAGSGYGTFLVVIKPALKTNDPVEIMTVVFLLGGLMLLPAVLLNPMDWIFTGHGLIVTLGLGFVTATLTFFFILKGLKSTSVLIAGALSIAEPFCAALWGIIFLGEQVGTQGYVGLALIFCSSILLVIPQKKIIQMTAS